jgi:flagellar hook protein FlgE
MSGMIDFSTPLAGMNAAEASLNRTASNIANFGGTPANAPGGDTLDLSTDMIGLIEARNNFSANVKAAQTEDQMTQSLLKMIG